jgi:hypothetical protein
MRHWEALADILYMLSQISGVPLTSVMDSNFARFEEVISGSWDYDLRGQDNFKSYVKNIWSLDGLIIGLTLAEEPIGFASFYYDSFRDMWLTEYFIVEQHRGIGFSKVVLPSFSQAFEDLDIKLGVAVKFENKRAQKAITKALGTYFPEAKEGTLYVVDLYPWTWKTRNRVADSMVIVITNAMRKRNNV